MAQGRDAKRIAERLHLSESIIRTHIKGMYRKLGIHDRQELFELLHPDTMR